MKNEINVNNTTVPGDKSFLTEKYLYISDKERLVDLVREMADEALKSLVTATESLNEAGGEKARSVIERDDVIDDMEETIDQECMYTIAMRQPMREDLRFVYAVTKIITDLERIGDQSENIANCSLNLFKAEEIKKSSHLEKIKPAFEEIFFMRARLEEMFPKLMTAFTNEDENAARKVMEMIGQFHKTGEKAENSLAVLASGGNFSEALHIFTNMLLIVKNLDRVGDHMMNIAERVCFIVTGISPVAIKKKAKNRE